MRDSKVIDNVDIFVRDKSFDDLVDKIKEMNEEIRKLLIQVDDLKLNEMRVTPKILEKVKSAFWRTFHKSGKIFFSQLEDADEVTTRKWNEFMANLVDNE